MSEEQKRGRTPRPGGPKPSFTFRLTAKLRAQIEAGAAESGRTLSEEVETRLERSYWEARAVSADRMSEDRVRQIVHSVLNERAGKHNASITVNGLFPRGAMWPKPVCPGDEVEISLRPRPGDGWRT